MSAHISGELLQQVHFILLAANNLSTEAAEGIFNISTIPNATQPEQLQAWADVHDYQLVIPALVDPLDDDGGDVTAIAWNASSETSAGYHRLLVLSSTQPALVLLDWLYVLPSERLCSGLLTSQGLCLPCPVGCFCTLDGRCWPQPGWWSVDEHSIPSSCILPASCPGALEAQPNADSPDPILNADGSRNTQRCAVHYEEQLCGECSANYFHDGSACRSCGSNQQNEFAGLATGATVLGALVGLVVAFAPARSLTRVITSLLFGQELIVIGQTATQVLPESYAWLQAVFTDVSIVNLDITNLHPGCFIDPLSNVDLFWATVCLIVAALLIFVMAAALRATLIVLHVKGQHGRGLFPWWWQPHHMHDHMPELNVSAAQLKSSSPKERTRQFMQRQELMMNWIIAWPVGIRADLTAGMQLGLLSHISCYLVFKARLHQALLVLSSLVYLRLTTAILKVLQCQHQPSLDGSGTAVLTLSADHKTLCYHGNHLPAAVVSWFLLFVFCIGFPLYLLKLLLGVHSTSYFSSRLDSLKAHTARVTEQVRTELEAVKHNNDQPRPKQPLRITSSDDDWPAFIRIHSASSTDVDDNYTSSAAGAATHHVVTMLSSPAVAAAQPPSINKEDGRQTKVATQPRRSRQPSLRRTDSLVGFAEQVDKQQVAAAQHYVQQCVTQRKLSVSESKVLDADYIAGCVEMVVGQRDSHYGYVVSNFHASWYFWRVVSVAMQFAFACGTVLPYEVILRVLLQGLTFVCRCLLVSLVWPYSGLSSNLFSILGSITLVAQSCVTLGLVQALTITTVTADVGASPAANLQAMLVATASHFYSANVTYIAILAGSLALVIVTSLLSYACRKTMSKQKRAVLKLTSLLPLVGGGATIAGMLSETRLGQDVEADLEAASARLPAFLHSQASSLDLQTVVSATGLAVSRGASSAPSNDSSPIAPLSPANQSLVSRLTALLPSAPAHFQSEAAAAVAVFTSHHPSATDEGNVERAAEDELAGTLEAAAWSELGSAYHRTMDKHENVSAMVGLLSRVGGSSSIAAMVSETRLGQDVEADLEAASARLPAFLHSQASSLDLQTVVSATGLAVSRGASSAPSNDSSPIAPLSPANQSLVSRLTALLPSAPAHFQSEAAAAVAVFTSHHPSATDEGNVERAAEDELAGTLEAAAWSELGSAYHRTMDKHENVSAMVGLLSRVGGSSSIAAMVSETRLGQDVEADLEAASARLPAFLHSQASSLDLQTVVSATGLAVSRGASSAPSNDSSPIAPLSPANQSLVSRLTALLPSAPAHFQSEAAAAVAVFTSHHPSATDEGNVERAAEDELAGTLEAAAWSELGSAYHRTMDKHENVSAMVGLLSRVGGSSSIAAMVSETRLGQDVEADLEAASARLPAFLHSQASSLEQSHASAGSLPSLSPAAEARTALSLLLKAELAEVDGDDGEVAGVVFHDETE